MPVMTAATTTDLDVSAYCNDLTRRAVAASRDLAATPGSARADALRRVAEHIRQSSDAIQAANAQDLAAGRDNGLSDAMLDRLKVDDARVLSIARSVDEIAEQTDPVGQIVEGRVLPNGVRLQKMRVPIGVVLIIFESRPNVTSDAAALCIKSGNATILRGGKEAMHSNQALGQCVQAGLRDAGVNPDAVQLVDTPERAVVGELLRKEGQIDLCIPRGGESLIRAVVEQAHIPVIKHYTGNCHVYVDANCDADMAESICVNAKTQRTGVCNAAETILFHKDAVATGLLKRVCAALAERGVEIRGDETTRGAFPDATPATDNDWRTEYLDKIVAVRVVDSLSDAVAHINTYGSKHTDAIVTSDVAAADAFVTGVDSGNVFVNCSTRFSDGGVYGLGAEIGISTDKLHARGPMGAADLTTYKWVARGDGQIRE